jgi:hypothetical protein
MDWLEDELKQALERKMPSADFAARVTAAAAAGRRSWFAPRRWMAAAAAILLMAGGATEYREYRGRVARDRVLLALRITAGKLNYIQNRAQRAPQRAPYRAPQTEVRP